MNDPDIMLHQNRIAEIIATRVRAQRRRLGMTRKQLAAAAGVSERYLNELENGGANATVAVLAKVADAVGESLVSLLSPGDGAANGAARAATEAPDGTLHALVRSMSRAEQEGALPILASYLERRRKSLKGLALLGLRGAGKTTLGERLARRHGLPFISVTREIETRAGMSLADLFNLGGPNAYRALENEVVADLARRGDRLVVETAGGIVGNSDALDMIFASFRTVWLKAAAEEHLSRVAGQGDTRPMRGNPRALDHLRQLLAAREQEYARAEYVIETTGRSIDACLEDLEAIAAPALQ